MPNNFPKSRTIQSLLKELSALVETFPAYGDIVKEIKADLEGVSRHDMAIAYITPERRVIYANHKITSLLGLEPQDTLGQDADMFIFQHPESYPDWNHTLIPLLAVSQKDIVRGKHILKTVNGTPLFCDYLYFAYRNTADQLKFIKGIFHDVTTLVKTNEQLIWEQEKTERILKSGTLGYWVYDIDNSTIQWSGDYRPITGYTTEEMSPSAARFKQMIHPDDLRRYYYSWESGELEAYKSGIEFRIKTRQGKYKWILSKIIDIKTDPHKNTRIASGIHIDIDEYKRAVLKIREKERQLIQNEENLRKIYKALPIGIVIYNNRGDYVESNDELLNIFGLKSKKEVSKANLLSIHPELRSIILQSDYSKDIGYDLADCRVYEDYTQAPKSPNTRYLNIKIISLLDKEGYVTLDNQKTDNDPGEGGNTEHESGYLMVVTDNTVLRRSELDLKMNAAALKEKNVVLARATERAQESDRLKSAFLTNVGHEIRTPLNAIIGFSELITTSENKQEKDLYFEIVKTNNDLLLKLITDILDLSKIESGRVDLNLSSVNLNQICRELIEKSSQTPENERIKLICKYPDHLITQQDGKNLLLRETVFTTDRERLKQIYIHLLSNAVKNTYRGVIALYHNLVEVSQQGKVLRTLSVEEADSLLEASSHRESGQKPENRIMVACSVSDTGCGIPEYKFREIFQRFTKLNDSQTGFGLGLPIVKALAEQMDGFVTVDSTVGKGSVFTVYLPYLINPAQPESWANIGDRSAEELEKEEMVLDGIGQLIIKDLDKNSSLIENFEKINIKIQTNDNIEEEINMSDRMLDILVAEDIDFNYMLVKAIIGKKHNLVRAKTGAEAVELFGKQKFNLILMDMKMPEMDGITATKLIREKDTRIPIIAVTAYAFDTDKQIALDAGCNTYIVKPIDPKILIAEIDKYALAD